MNFAIVKKAKASENPVDGTAFLVRFQFG